VGLKLNSTDPQVHNRGIMLSGVSTEESSPCSAGRRSTVSHPSRCWRWITDDALTVLRHRYADGETDEEEFDVRRRKLQDGE
jgi:hypothetical protein